MTSGDCEKWVEAFWTNVSKQHKEFDMKIDWYIVEIDNNLYFLSNSEELEKEAQFQNTLARLDRMKVYANSVEAKIAKARWNKGAPQPSVNLSIDYDMFDQEDAARYAYEHEGWVTDDMFGNN
jgi:hypothetical protein